MSRPNWWPMNPWNRERANMKQHDAWEAGTNAMAKALIERIEAIANYMGPGFQMPSIDADVWEAFKDEVEQS